MIDSIGHTRLEPQVRLRSLLLYTQLILIRSCTPIKYVSRGTPRAINTKIVVSIIQSIHSTEPLLVFFIRHTFEGVLLLHSRTLC